MRLPHGFFSLLVIACLLIPAAPSGAAGQGDGFAVQKRSGWKAPAFELKDINGQSRRLDEFKGKVVLLHFFASWCEPCKKEFPSLVRLRSMLSEKGFEVVAVSEDSLERTVPFVVPFKADFPIVIDQYGGAMRSYKVKLIPASVVIDKNGDVSAVITGPREYESGPAVDYFESLLNKK